MLSYHGDSAIKEKYIARMKAHMAADELVQGIGWEKNGVTRGCAVGCTLDAYNHAAYEIELGIPRILAHLEDRIFEGLSVKESRDFPLNFLEAVPVGKDLSNVYKHFFIWMLTNPENGVIKFANTDQTKTAIQNVSDLLAKSLLQNVTAEEFAVVWEAAYKARKAADADAAAAAAAAAADAAAYADAAYGAAAAVDAAVDAAYAYADAAARRKYYSKMGSKLIDLLKTA